MRFLFLVVSFAPVVASADYVTFGAGAGSKWGPREYGQPAVVTWGFMLDGTTVDPARDIAAEVTGGSDITQMRADFDATYGAGGFDAAIVRAMQTWSAAAAIEFVGPMPDSGLQVGASGATDPDIRIGAFTPVAQSGFSFVGGVGFGPPGDAVNFPDPFAGDILFNVDATFVIKPGEEDDPADPYVNDLENLTLHELGHAAIGLGHPASGPGDVMYVGFPDCCDFINRELSDDDIAGARLVYGPKGDYNTDGRVDAADYAVWRNLVGGSDPRADGNADDVVDEADYLIWRENYGVTAPVIESSGAWSAPEPSTLALLTMASILASRAVSGRGDGPDR